MFNIDYVLDSRLSDIIYALEVFGSGTLPNTAQAVARSADAVVNIWSGVAAGSFKHATGDYLHHIEKGKIYPFNNDRFQAAVINQSTHARSVEYGRTSADIQKMLSTSDKVRVSKKDGKRYLVVPLRHGIPGSVEYAPMPKEVYGVASGLTESRKTGSRIEPSQQGAKSYKEAQMYLIQGHPSGKTTQRFEYQWGGRLSKKMMVMSNIQDLGKSPQWKSSKFEGMVKFPRDQKSSMYMTFRVIKEGTQGWTYPGLHIAERAQKSSKFVVNRIIRQGFEEDIKAFTRMYV